MSDMYKLQVAERAEFGKGPNRRMRADGIVPGVYYNQEGLNIPVKVERNTLIRAWKTQRGSNVIDLEVDRDGKTENYPALIWRLKYDPVQPLPIHVDFFGVDLEKEIKVFVPFALEGTSAGVKLGGRMEQYRERVEVSCKPLNIPDAITIDVTELNVGDAIRIEDVTFPEGITVQFDENYAVLSVIAKGAAVDEGEESEEGEEEVAAEE